MRVTVISPERAVFDGQAEAVSATAFDGEIGILPRHTAWGRFFRGLEFVVLDELHVYRGVFGSNVGCVLRRLRRICRHYGSDPVFIFTSATIANPGDLAESLAGIKAKVIDDDGAPRGARKFIFWNPPVIGADGTRRSSHSEATQLFTGLVESGIRNITFTKARRSAELILRYARETLSERSPALAEKVMSYRGGYRPAERRQIESGLFNGKLLGVVATDWPLYTSDAADDPICVDLGGRRLDDTKNRH